MTAPCSSCGNQSPSQLRRRAGTLPEGIQVLDLFLESYQLQIQVVESAEEDRVVAIGPSRPMAGLQAHGWFRRGEGRGDACVGREVGKTIQLAA